MKWSRQRIFSFFLVAKQKESLTEQQQNAAKCANPFLHATTKHITMHENAPGCTDPLGGGAVFLDSIPWWGTLNSWVLDHFWSVPWNSVPQHGAQHFSTCHLTNPEIVSFHPWRFVPISTNTHNRSGASDVFGLNETSLNFWSLAYHLNR